MSVNTPPDPDHIRTLFVLFPRKMKDKEALWNIHPGIEAVKYSRKRAGRWCHIRFGTEELANQARKALHKKKVPHGRLIVAETKKKKLEVEGKAKKANFNILYVSHIPRSVTKDDLKSAFKTSKKILIKPTRSRKQFNAQIIMRTHAEALELFADKESHKVNGIPLTLKFPTSFYNYLQNAQKEESEAMNVIESQQLEGVETVETEVETMKTEVETMKTEVEGENSHIMQKYAVQVGKANNSDVSMQEEEEENLRSPAVQDISEDDDMEG